MSTRIRLVTLVLIVLLGASGCGGQEQGTTPTPGAPLAAAIVAEGHALPARSLHLSFLAAGRVEAIHVARGERVSAGQVLARLGDSQAAQAALAAAGLEQEAARQAYETLLRTAGLEHAQAWQAYLDAQKAAAAAQLAWDRLDQSALQDLIDDAREDVDTRQVELDQAQADFDEYAELPSGNATRQRYEDALRTARSSYDQAVQKLVDATRRLELVRTALDSALGLQAEARRNFESTLEGPHADRLALAEGRLEAAEAQLEAAQAAVDAYALKAPFSGIVADVNLSLGQMVGPETWAVALVDPRSWYVETSDLSELDIVHVSPGQPVELVADALPEEVMHGVVEEIGQAPRVQAGDVLYLVRIRVSDPDPRLLWGMTVEVTFPAGE